MKIKEFLVLIVLILIGQSSLWANYSPDSYGQKDFEQYYGPRDLIYRVDEFSGKVIFEDRDIHQNYWMELTQQELGDFSKFFFGEFSRSLTCPQSELAKMYDYLQFTNRVLTLSYLYENINARKNIAKRLDIKNICEVDWKKQFDSCQPKSQDMEFFIKSAKHISKNQKEFHLSSSESLKNYKNKWIQELKNRSYKDEAQYRISKACAGGKCRTVNQAILEVQKSCEGDIKLFNSVCSESDKIYGLNYINESYSLIVNSDILDVADDNGYAAGCLRVFKQMSKSKEAYYPQLRLIFPITYHQMNKNKKRYMQGDLFPAGSMKKFVDMGLEELFKEEKKVVKVKKETKKAKKVEVVENKVEFIDRFIKKKKTPKKIVKAKTIKKRIPKKIKKSSFLLAVELQKESNASSVKVDMLRFKYDFLFSMTLKKLLDDNLKIYVSRSGLTEMKNRDDLGSKKGPMPLMFLKYLIETQKHQALFNLVSIVGSEFFVRNDIDLLKTDPYNYVELLNDQSTNHSWQINIKKYTPKKKAKK